MCKISLNWCFLIIVVLCSCVNSEKESEVEFSPQLIEAVSQYDCFFEFQNGMAAVVRDNKFGYINDVGEEVIPCSYGFDHYEGLVEDMGGSSLIQHYSEGVVAIPLFKFRSDEPELIDYSTMKWGLYNKKGEQILPHQYDNAICFSEGIAYASQHGINMFIDKKGNKVFELKDDLGVIGEFSCGLCLVAIHKKGYGFEYGFIDKRGETVIPCQYTLAESFSEGLAYVEEGDKFKGFINKENKKVISCAEYEYVGAFSDEMAIVKKDGRFGFINKEGILVIPCEYKGFEGEGGEYFCDSKFVEGTCFIDGIYIDKNGNKIKGNTEDKSLHPQIEVYGNYCDGSLIYRYKSSSDNKILIENKHNMDDEYEDSNNSVGSVASNKGNDTYSSYSGMNSDEESEKNIEIFNSPSDVIAYTSSNTFKKGNIRISIKFEGLYINGQCQSGAPQVEIISSSAAMIKVNAVPTGTIEMMANSSKGVIVELGTGVVYEIE